MRKSLMLCLLALLTVAGNAFAVGEGRIQGKVTDAATKAPVANVVIQVVSTGSRSFKADYKGEKDGSYRFLILDATLPYKFTYSAPGYQPFTVPIKLKLGDATIQDVKLVPASAAAAATPGAAAPAKADPAVVAYNEGAALANEGKNAEAIAKMELAIAAKPEFIAGLEGVAKLYLRTKQYAKAIERANSALAISADEMDMYAVLADAYAASGDKVKAAEARKKLPADPTSLFNDAARLINSGKDKEAEVLLKQAIVANDKMAPAYYELGMIYVRGQKNADAKANLQKYLELDPSGKDAATAKEMLKYVK
ncbi:MAG: carboxypeptidase regulatory-like domain-containing protein [Thermoanaerobaculia bacterium]